MYVYYNVKHTQTDQAQGSIGSMTVNLQYLPIEAPAQEVSQEVYMCCMNACLLHQLAPRFAAFANTTAATANAAPVITFEYLWLAFLACEPRRASPLCIHS